MTRQEFMRQLESLLHNVSDAEREEAMQYYNDYFEDAGPENEQAVIDALGNPAKVAENIKRDLGIENATERTIDRNREIMEYREPIAVTAKEEEKKSLPTWAIVLIVILCFLASPVLLGIASGAFGLLLGILGVWFSIIVGCGAAAIALFVVMFVLVIVGFLCIPVSPLVCIAVLGVALLLGGLAILFMMITVAMAGIATPAIVSGIAKLFRKKKSK